MTATMTSTLPRTTSKAAPVLRAGALGAAVAAAALAAYCAVAQALSIPMKAQGLGAHAVAAITPGDCAFGVVFSTTLGTLLAVVLNRRAANPARTFLRTAIVLTAVSYFSPLAATHIALSTQLTLIIGHTLAAAIVIPIITRRLPHHR